MKNPLPFLFGCSLAMLFLFTGSAVHAQAKWTFMVYLDADNNLEPFGIIDFNEMEQVGSTSDVNIIVQMDRAPGMTIPTETGPEPSGSGSPTMPIPIPYPPPSFRIWVK